VEFQGNIIQETPHLLYIALDHLEDYIALDHLGDFTVQVSNNNSNSILLMEEVVAMIIRLICNQHNRLITSVVVRLVLHQVAVVA
jgi:hypothetical protein